MRQPKLLQPRPTMETSREPILRDCIRQIAMSRMDRNFSAPSRLLACWSRRSARPIAEDETKTVAGKLPETADLQPAWRRRTLPCFMNTALQGILLRKRKLSDTSLIVSWCTDSLGIIQTVARGARRPKSPFRGQLDLFFEAELS